MSQPTEHLPSDFRTALDRWTVIVPWLLGCIAAALVIASALSLLYIKYSPPTWYFAYHILRLFSLGELTFAAWFSSCLLILCGTLTAIIATICSQEKDPDTWRWWAATILLAAMSADETISIHELLGSLIRRSLHLEGFFYNNWVVAGIPMVLLIFLTLGPILIRLPQMLSHRLLFAAFVFFGGAVGIEMINGKVRSESEEGYLIF